MNTRKGKAKFKNFQIILDSGCSSTVVNGKASFKNYILKRFCDAVEHTSW